MKKVKKSSDAVRHIKYNAVEQIRKASEEKLLKELQEIEDALERDLKQSRRNCAIGCKYFGRDVIHFCCEPETTKDIIDNQKEDQRCKIPPEGWWCSRESGHTGPCAARPTVKKVITGYPRPKPTGYPSNIPAPGAIPRPKPTVSPAPSKYYHECKSSSPECLHSPRHCNCCNTWYCTHCFIEMEKPTLWTRIKMWLSP